MATTEVCPRVARDLWSWGTFELESDELTTYPGGRRRPGRLITTALRFAGDSRPLNASRVSPATPRTS